MNRVETIVGESRDSPYESIIYAKESSSNDLVNADKILKNNFYTKEASTHLIIHFHSFKFESRNGHLF
jgi:hypothetical protein